MWHFVLLGVVGPPLGGGIPCFGFSILGGVGPPPGGGVCHIPRSPPPQFREVLAGAMKTIDACSSSGCRWSGSTVDFLFWWCSSRLCRFNFDRQPRCGLSLFLKLRVGLVVTCLCESTRGVFFRQHLSILASLV